MGIILLKIVVTDTIKYENLSSTRFQPDDNLISREGFCIKSENRLDRIYRASIAQFNRKGREGYRKVRKGYRTVHLFNLK